MNKLRNPNLSINDVESANEIPEIKNCNNENMKQVKKLGEQISEEFDQVRQLIKYFNIKDHDKLK